MTGTFFKVQRGFRSPASLVKGLQVDDDLKDHSLLRYWPTAVSWSRQQTTKMDHGSDSLSRADAWYVEGCRLNLCLKVLKWKNIA